MNKLKPERNIKKQWHKPELKVLSFRDTESGSFTGDAEGDWYFNILGS